MEIAKRQVGDIAVIDLTGEIDIYNAGQLKSALQELISQKQYRVVLNMKRVSYMDSTGIGVLLTSLNPLKQNQGDLKLANAAESIQKVFKLTNLSKFFHLLDSEEAAIGSFSRN